MMCYHPKHHIASNKIYTLVYEILILFLSKENFDYAHLQKKNLISSFLVGKKKSIS